MKWVRRRSVRAGRPAGDQKATAPEGTTGRRRPHRLGLVTGLGVAVLVLLGGALLWHLSPKEYRAESTLLVLPTVEAGQFAGYYDVLSEGQVVGTFAEIVDLRSGAALSTDTVHIEVHAIPDTSLLSVVAIAPDPVSAEEAADSVLEAARPYLDQISAPYDVSVVRGAAGSAQQTGVPVGPLLVVVPLVALVAGFAAQQAVRALQAPGHWMAGAVTDGPARSNGRDPRSTDPSWEGSQAPAREELPADPDRELSVGSEDRPGTRSQWAGT